MLVDLSRSNGLLVTLYGASPVPLFATPCTTNRYVPTGSQSVNCQVSFQVWSRLCSVTSTTESSVATGANPPDPCRCRVTNAFPRGASTEGSPPFHWNTAWPKRDTFAATSVTTVPA